VPRRNRCVSGTTRRLSQESTHTDHGILQPGELGWKSQLGAQVVQEDRADHPQSEIVKHGLQTQHLEDRFFPEPAQAHPQIRKHMPDQRAADLPWEIRHTPDHQKGSSKGERVEPERVKTPECGYCRTGEFSRLHDELIGGIGSRIFALCQHWKHGCRCNIARKREQRQAESKRVELPEIEESQ
jgi:hypothetical protein